METAEWYLFFHLAGVFLLLAAAGLTTGTAVAAGRTRSAGTVVTLLFGSLLVDKAGYGFGEAWISTAYTLFIVILAVDHGYFLRQNRKIRAAAAAAEDGAVTAEVRGMLGNPVLTAVGVLMDLGFVVFLWLMIAKPGN
jgi:uncharacterized membrane protein